MAEMPKWQEQFSAALRGTFSQWEKGEEKNLSRKEARQGPKRTRPDDSGRA